MFVLVTPASGTPEDSKVKMHFVLAVYGLDTNL